jgi:hypothetical protein
MNIVTKGAAWEKNMKKAGPSRCVILKKGHYAHPEPFFN